jgi:lipopolysaccharide assembly outer membrane protein LptD (OstA)
MRSELALFAVFVLAAALAPSPAAAQPPSTGDAADREPYHLSADRLSGSAAAGENVYTAIHATVVHGATTVTGDSALVYRNKELVLFRGNVKIIDGATTMWGREASYDRKTRVAVLRGDVRIEEGGSKITGREATFYRDRNVSVIVGKPKLEDSTRTLIADRIEYDRNTDVATALGNVDAIDRAESTRVLAGRVRYDRRSDYAWADKNPRLELTESGGIVTRVAADSMEFDNARSRVIANGRVRIVRQKLEAAAGRAEFYRNEERALLVQSPRAWDPEGSASGDTLDLRFSGNRISSIQARPNAKVSYEALPDSGRGERTEASGDTITLFLENDAARRALIVGHATSFYWPAAADSAAGGRNASAGDTIVVEFEGGKPVRATVLGRGDGTYYMVAEGDTTGAEARERIRYKGRRILYDVNKHTVDVAENAEVAYREMRLQASTVTFNSQTEKMRAVGSPVLVDGGDRITGETMTYDLSIRRGTVYSGRTKYEQGYVSGRRVRRVSEDILDVEDGTYTTCDELEPHYHFGSQKMKIMLHDKVVAKPIVFYIKRIPVLALPFYIFPIKSGRHSGFQLPQLEFGSADGGGKFVRNLGYYWAINDYLDATLWADYYQDDRWVAHGQGRYHKRYGYQGQLSGSYENRYSTGSNRWDLVGRHYQTLGTNFSLTAQANLTNASDYYKDEFLGRSVLVRVQRNLRSSVSIQKGWSGASLNVGALRNQDLDPDPGGLRIQQQAPTATFSLSTRPIGRAARGREPARLPFLASTTYSYRATLISQRNIYVNGYSDTIPREDAVTDARTGTRHDVTLTDVRSLGAFRVSPTFNMSGIYYSRDDSGDRNRVGASWSTGIGMNTAIYGTTRRSFGPLRALRHVVTPAVSYSYRPEIKNLSFPDTSGLRRARFVGIGGVGLSSSEQRAMNFSLRNDVHVKWGSADRPKTINNLIQLATSGSYDFLAKRTGRKPLSDLFSSLHVQPIERSGFDFSFVHNPYDGKMLSFGASTGLTLQGKTAAASDETDGGFHEEPGADAVQEGNYLNSASGLTPAGLPWSVSVRVGYNGNRARVPGGTYAPWQSSARMNGSLGLNLSKNWRLDYAAQYDMRHRDLVSQNFTLKRELHCWEAQFTRSISGETSEYYFKINVKLLPEVYYEKGSRGLRGFGGIDQLY